MYRLGEYPIAAKFPNLQSSFYLIFYGATGEGDLLIDVFREDGTIVSSVTINNVVAGPYYFSTPTVEMSGFSIWNTDIGGLGIYQIGYNYQVADECFCITIPTVAGEFDTNGSLDGQSLELSPGDAWTYTNTTATVTDGIVTPSVFNVDCNFNFEYLSEFCFSGTIGTDEQLLFGFTDGWNHLYLWIAPGTENSLVEYFVYGGEGGNTTIRGYFTPEIDYNEKITIGMRMEQGAIKVYLGPNFINPIYTLYHPKILAYFMPDSVFCGDGWETASSLDYFRFCNIGNLLFDTFSGNGALSSHTSNNGVTWIDVPDSSNQGSGYIDNFTIRDGGLGVDTDFSGYTGPVGPNLTIESEVYTLEYQFTFNTNCTNRNAQTEICVGVQPDGSKWYFYTEFYYPSENKFYIELRIVDSAGLMTYQKISRFSGMFYYQGSPNSLKFLFHDKAVHIIVNGRYETSFFQLDWNYWRVAPWSGKTSIAFQSGWWDFDLNQPRWEIPSITIDTYNTERLPWIELTNGVTQGTWENSYLGKSYFKFINVGNGATNLNISVDLSGTTQDVAILAKLNGIPGGGEYITDGSSPNTVSGDIVNPGAGYWYIIIYCIGSNVEDPANIPITATITY